MELTDTQDDLWSPIMPRAHHRTVVLIVKCRRPEINQVDLRTEQHPPELGTPRRQRTTARDIPVVRERLVCVIQQQNVLWLEIGVDEIKIVQERYRAK